MSTLLRINMDSYGEWRWNLADNGTIVLNSYESSATRDEALEEATNALTEAGITADHTVMDGTTEPIVDKMRPPKVDAILEARRGGYAAPGQEGEVTPEGAKAREQIVTKMIDAEKKVREKRTPAPKLDEAPDVGMEEPKAKTKVKNADGTPAVQEEPNPLAAQRRKVKQTVGDGT